jgi:hypothetical protein
MISVSFESMSSTIETLRKAVGLCSCWAFPAVDCLWHASLEFSF